MRGGGNSTIDVTKAVGQVLSFFKGFDGAAPKAEESLDSFAMAAGRNILNTGFGAVKATLFGSVDGAKPVIKDRATALADWICGQGINDLSCGVLAGLVDNCPTNKAS